jgi:hypothetical protein
MAIRTSFMICLLGDGSIRSAGHAAKRICLPTLVSLPPLSAVGTKQTYRVEFAHVRFRSEADADDRAALTASVADDPKRSWARLKSRSAAAPCHTRSVLSLDWPARPDRFRTFQVYPKDLPAAPRQVDRAVD